MVSRRTSSASQVTTCRDYGKKGRIISFNVQDLLDLSSSERFREEIQGYLSEMPRARYCVDFSDILHLPSSMYASLIVFNNGIRQNGGEGLALVVDGEKGDIAEALADTKLDRLFTIYQSVEDFLN